jgi:rRNA processing protein Krr1/Pno1
MIQNLNYSSNMSAAQMRNACKNSTITTITNPKTKTTIKRIVMMMVRGIKERRTLRKFLTPRNLEQRSRVPSCQCRQRQSPESYSGIFAGSTGHVQQV